MLQAEDDFGQSGLLESGILVTYALVLDDVLLTGLSQPLVHLVVGLHQNLALRELLSALKEEKNNNNCMMASVQTDTSDQLVNVTTFVSLISSVQRFYS